MKPAGAGDEPPSAIEAVAVLVVQSRLIALEGHDGGRTVAIEVDGEAALGTAAGNALEGFHRPAAGNLVVMEIEAIIVGGPEQMIGRTRDLDLFGALDAHHMPPVSRFCHRHRSNLLSVFAEF